jgi:hypothetical protein
MPTLHVTTRQLIKPSRGQNALILNARACPRLFSKAGSQVPSFSEAVSVSKEVL